MLRSRSTRSSMPVAAPLQLTDTEAGSTPGACMAVSASSNTTEAGPSRPVGGHFLVAMRVTTMHEDCILVRRRHQPRIDPVGRQKIVPHAPPFRRRRSSIPMYRC